MPIYTCETCKTEFKKKDRYDYHINRKRKCVPPSSNPKMPPEAENTTARIGVKIRKVIKCTDCNAEFLRKDYLLKHKKLGRCPMKNQVEEIHKMRAQMTEIQTIMTEKVEKMASIIEDLSHKLETKSSSSAIIPTQVLPQTITTDNSTHNTDNSTHNTDNSITDNSVNDNRVINNTVNNNTSIKVVAFGEEDYNQVLKDLTDQEKMRIYEAGDDCIAEAVKVLHCNDRLPQYQNIFNPNVRADYCTIMTETGLERANKKDTMKRLVSQKGRMVSKMLEHPPSNVHRGDLMDAQDAACKVYRGSRLYNQKHHEELARKVAITLPQKPAIDRKSLIS